MEPVKQPTIIGIEAAYKPGQDLNVTCIAKVQFRFIKRVLLYTGLFIFLFD